MNMKTHRPLGWTIAMVLLGLYLFLKLQGWWYLWQVQRLERKLEDLRPTLSSIVLCDQLGKSGQACKQAFEQIRRMDLPGSHTLEQLSQQLPDSVTITQLDMDSQMGLRFYGSILAGVRNPEGTLLSWANKLRADRNAVRIQELIPDHSHPGSWVFELKVEGS